MTFTTSYQNALAFQLMVKQLANFRNIIAIRKSLYSEIHLAVKYFAFYYVGSHCLQRTNAGISYVYAKNIKCTFYTIQNMKRRKEGWGSSSNLITN